MSLVKWIESLYEPEKTNFRDAGLEDLLLALEQPAIRKHWVNALVEELRAINVGVDRSLREGKIEDLKQTAARRTALVFCLNQILDSRTAIENEQYDLAHNNEARDGRGIAVQGV